MATYTCYVRIHLPLKSNGKPDTNNEGWYDLEIRASGQATIPIRTTGSNTVNIKNPVFRYGHIDGAGYVKVFSDDNTTVVSSDDTFLCKYKFTTSDVSDFTTMMKNHLTYRLVFF